MSTVATIGARHNSHRDYQGRYDYGDMNAMCVCGHALAVHAADNESGKRPCFNEDRGLDRATGDDCDCPHFRKVKK